MVLADAAPLGQGLGPFVAELDRLVPHDRARNRAERPHIGAGQGRGIVQSATLVDGGDHGLLGLVGIADDVGDRSLHAPAVHLHGGFDVVVPVDRLADLFHHVVRAGFGADLGDVHARLGHHVEGVFGVVQDRSTEPSSLSTGLPRANRVSIDLIPNPAPWEMDLIQNYTSPLSISSQTLAAQRLGP